MRVIEGDTVPTWEVSPMPTSDSHTPLLPRAEQIRRREFATVRRGYDSKQVRTYLTSLADQVEKLEREVRQLRLEVSSVAARGEPVTAPVTTLNVASPTEDPYDSLSKRFASLIRMADEEAEKILENVRSEATRVLDQATSEADRIRVDAQARARDARQESTDLLERAKTESDRALSSLADRRRSLVVQLEEMRGKLIAVAEDLAVSVDEAVGVDANETELADMSDDDEADTDGVELADMSDNDEADAEALRDPRYEDLWVKKEEPLQIPGLTSLDLNLDERDE
jgi:DivIVA domain-containing protein